VTWAIEMNKNGEEYQKQKGKKLKKDVRSYF
jgi:hypothetical protein